MEKESQKEKPSERVREKTLKLTYKEQIALDKLPEKIDALEKLIEEKKSCLADPKCYENIGITTLADELNELEDEYEAKVEELLTIEEKQELIAQQDV